MIDKHVVDIINFMFINGAAVCTFYNMWVIYKKKESVGLSITSQVFFFVWTLWSLYFYGSIMQWWSLAAELILSVACLCYLAQMCYYIHKNKHK